MHTFIRRQALSAERYRTLWRWHFYAGLFVMPFLVVLALSGTLYCFQPQIESWLYQDRLYVRQPVNAKRLAGQVLLARAASVAPRGAVPSSAKVSPDPWRSAEFVFALPAGGSESIYLNPYDGRLLGTLSVEHRLMAVTRRVHRSLLIGKPGEWLMELAGCWTLVMIVTGLALWWPRLGDPDKHALSPDLSRKGRSLWKEFHVVGGIWLAAGALAFVLTGLPWTGLWGKQFKALTTQAGLGVPQPATGEPRQAHAGHVPDANEAVRRGEGQSMPGMQMDDLPLASVPWATGATKISGSTSPPGERLSLDQVMAIAAHAGIHGVYDVVLPRSAQDAYTVSYYPSDPRQERTMQIDARSGRVISDIGYPQYGKVAKWISFGTDLHMGRFFGLANQLVCTFISLGLAGMAVSGLVMWWKRRPGRPRLTLAAPLRVQPAPPMRFWFAGLALLGAVFPLMGLTLIFVWLVDTQLARVHARSVGRNAAATGGDRR